jgi:acetyltransferase-like isoleucine patch superfamily enzyme
VSIASDLFRRRTKAPIWTRDWAKLWAKRALLLDDLIITEARTKLLKLKGANIGHLSAIGKIQVNGRCSYLTIGGHSFLGSVSLTLFDKIDIGAFVTINDDVKLLTATHNIRSAQWERIAKPICIDDFAWIAQGAVILPGVRIGRGAVVGAYSVIREDVPAGMLAVGNPATLADVGRPDKYAYDPARGRALFAAWLGSKEAV